MKSELKFPKLTFYASTTYKKQPEISCSMTFEMHNYTLTLNGFNDLG